MADRRDHLQALLWQMGLQTWASDCFAAMNPGQPLSLLGRERPVRASDWRTSKPSSKCASVIQVSRVISI